MINKNKKIINNYQEILKLKKIYMSLKFKTKIKKFSLPKNKINFKIYI